MIKKLRVFSDRYNLSLDPSCFQVLGRNNPVALKKSQNRGYEFLLTVPDSFVVDKEYKEFTLPGGLYAAVMSKGIAGMQKNWASLIEWIKQNNEYTFGYPADYDFENSPSLELEHHLNPLDINEDSMLIDYYFPVMAKS